VDTVTTARTAAQSLSELVNAVDTVTTARTAAQSLSELVNAVDTVTTARTAAQSLSEQVDITDTVATSNVFSKSLSEQVDLTDTVATAAAKSKSLSEQVDLTDTVATAAAKSKSLSEQVDIVDTVAPARTFSKSLSEQANVDDSMSTTTTFSKSLFETINLPDTTMAVSGFLATSSEQANIADTVATVGTFFNSPSEQASVTDTTALVSIPSSVPMTFVLPTTGTVSTAIVSVVNPTTSGGTITFLQSTIDITLGGGASCATGCTITFNFTDLDLAAAGISDPTDAIIFQDSEEDGTFVALTTTLTDGAPSPYTVSATTTSTSLFGVGTIITPPAPAPTPSGGGGSGRTGVGGGGGGGGGILSDFRTGKLMLYEVSWDVCESNQVSILAGTDGDPRSLSAKIRTSSSGVTKATLATEQPFEKENKITKAQRLLFIAPLDPSDTFLIATAEDGASSISEVVNLKECTGKTVISEFEKQQSITKIPPIKSEKPPSEAAQPSIGEPAESGELQAKIAKPSIDEAGNLFSVIKKWSGRTSESASDSEILEAIGVEGDHIPSWFKKNAKWVLLQRISQAEFVDAIKYMSKTGALFMHEVPKSDIERIPTETVEPETIDDNLRTTIIMSIVITVLSVAIFVIVKAKRSKGPTIKLATTLSTDQVAVKGFTSAPQQLIYKDIGAQAVVQRLDSKEAANKIDEMDKKFSQMSEEEILERVNKSPSESQYLIAVYPFCKKWNGVMNNGIDMKSISGSGAVLIPFKVKNATGNVTIYNVLIQKLSKDGELIVSVIKNGVPIDVEQTEEPLGRLSLTGRC
jgi:hypothetical protein